MIFLTSKKIKLNNLAIVSTKFQLTNAAEVSNFFFKNKKLNVIIFILNKTHLEQINELKNLYNIDIIFTVKFRVFFQYIDLIFKLIKLMNNYSIDNLIVGHLRNNLMLFCIRVLKFKKLNFVDDGEIIEVIDQKPSINKKYFPIDYYSIFSLQSNHFFQFHKNDYQNLKLNYKKNSTNRTLFIGSPLVECDVIPKKLFFSIMEKIIEKEMKIDYFLHPRESVEKFETHKNINLLNYKSGIEQYIIECDMLPAKIISFYSTAMTSLKLILNLNKIDISFIDLRKYHKSKSIRDVEYNYLKINYSEYDLD